MHLASNNFLYPHQGAYQNGKSTEDILLIIIIIVDKSFPEQFSKEILE